MQAFIAPITIETIRSTNIKHHKKGNTMNVFQMAAAFNAINKIRCLSNYLSVEGDKVYKEFASHILTSLVREDADMSEVSYNLHGLFNALSEVYQNAMTSDSLPQRKRVYAGLALMESISALDELSE